MRELFVQMIDPATVLIQRKQHKVQNWDFANVINGYEEIQNENQQTFLIIQVCGLIQPFFIKNHFPKIQASDEVLVFDQSSQLQYVFSRLFLVAEHGLWHQRRSHPLDQRTISR